MQAFFYFFVIFEKWPQRWDWVAIIAYFGMTEWLNHYVVGKIGFEFGISTRWKISKSQPISCRNIPIRIQSAAAPNSETRSSPRFPERNTP